METFLNTQFLHSLRFRRLEIHYSQFLKATTSEWSRKPGSTSVSACTRGYYRFGLMDFRNFFIPYVFRGQVIHFLLFLEANMSEWPRKSRSTSGFGGSTRWYCRLGPMDFSNFSIPYVFHVKESIFRSITKLSCSGDLENPGQLLVLQKLEGTEVWVLWIFVRGRAHII